MQHFDTIYRIQADRAEQLRGDAERASRIAAARGSRHDGLRTATARILRELAERLDPRSRTTSTRTTGTRTA